MKKFILLILIFNTLVAFPQSYLKYPRVKKAYDEKFEYIKQKLAEKNLTPTNYNLLIIGLKKEKDLQVWVKHKDSTKYSYLLSYKFCVLSGDLGPKRQEGDGQVPEGFYHISVFNPYSNFYLSLGINYPNLADRILGKTGNLGGDIYIHGDCVSIGCIPITDDKIKELYLFAVMAKENHQKKIPVYLFPTAMTDKNLNQLYKNEKYSNYFEFWSNLKQGYDIFMKTKKELKFYVNKKGKYVFQ